jgi:hypothetical protein
MSKWCISTGFVREAAVGRIEAEDARALAAGARQPHGVAEDDADVVAGVHRVHAVDHPGAGRVVERDLDDLEEVAHAASGRAVVDQQPVVREVGHARGRVRPAAELGIPSLPSTQSGRRSQSSIA